jgi:gliding motility-associated-like protein
MKLLQSIFCFLISGTLLIAQNVSETPKNLQQGKELLSPKSIEKVKLELSQYEKLKSENKLDPSVRYVVTFPEGPADVSSQRTLPSTQIFSSALGELTSPPCSYVPTDDFLIPFGGNVHFDDSPPNGAFEVSIPFEFCFYGQTYTSFFINNNGNITFDEQFNTFTAQSFPAPGIPPMIAPFWGDVDTGSNTNPLGQVRYNVYADYAIISWDTVAVYDEIASLRNTFQVIISNGQSSAIPVGNNIAFLYGDMQWTTGNASGGSNGFGGTPATVGVNRGNGVDYIQLGLFDAPGTNYDGPFGNVDQVSFLDYSVYFFNTCLDPGAGNNISPLSIGAPICDTINLCAGSTYNIDFSFIPVESNQTVSAELLTPDLEGLTITSITTGAQSDVLGTFTGNTNNLGFNVITFRATDNGTPAASYTIDLIIRVSESQLTATISGDDEICEGESTILSIVESNFVDYLWYPGGQTTPSISVSQPGDYSVTVFTDQSCGVSQTFSLQELPLPEPVIEGVTGLCGGGTGEIYTTEMYTSYLWNNSSVNDTITITPGTYTVTVTDSSGCSKLSAPYVVEALTQLFPVIVGDNHTCFDELNTISCSQNFATYTWSNGSTSPFIEENEGSFTVTVSDTFGCSGTSAPFVITNSNPASDISGIVPYCKNDSILVTGDGNYASYIWYNENGEIISETNETYTTGDSIFLVVVDDFGCRDSVGFSVPSTLPPVASFTSDPLYQTVLLPATVKYWDTSTITGTDSLDAWLWTFNPNTPGVEDFVVFEQHPLINFPDTGYRVITLVVTSEIGCKDTVSSWVYIIDKPFVPNVFSPGGDGYNDYFKVPFIDNYPDNLVLIYNRWGKKVFEGSNYKGDWDGDSLPSGTYYYVVSAPTLDKPLKGTVTLIRN